MLAMMAVKVVMGEVVMVRMVRGGVPGDGDDGVCDNLVGENDNGDDGDHGFDGDSDEVGNDDDGTARGGDSSWGCDGW